MKENKAQIFRPNRLKNLIMLLGCSFFVAIGLFIIDEEPIIGWGCVLFFGLGVITSLILFYPDSTYLILTDKGFEVKGLFPSNLTKWTDVKDLRAGSIRGVKMIFFDYTEEHKKWNTGKKVAEFLSGKQGAILSIWQIKTKDLLDLMNYYKLKNK